MHSILIDEEVEEEIQFLGEVKKLLNQIRESCNNSHMEIIYIIDEIYHLAIDKKLNENLKIQHSIPLKEELLNLFKEDVILDDEENLNFEDEEMIDEFSGEDNNTIEADYIQLIQDNMINQNDTDYRNQNPNRDDTITSVDEEFMIANEELDNEDFMNAIIQTNQNLISNRIIVANQEFFSNEIIIRVIEPNSCDEK